jgi:hypothetical protein
MEAVGSRGALAEAYLRAEIFDVVCGEGSARTERHELGTRWREKLARAGMAQVPFGPRARAPPHLGIPEVRRPRVRRQPRAELARPPALLGDGVAGDRRGRCRRRPRHPAGSGTTQQQW